MSFGEEDKGKKRDMMDLWRGGAAAPWPPENARDGGEEERRVIEGGGGFDRNIYKERKGVFGEGEIRVVLVI